MKSDNPAYTQSFVKSAINLYNALGRDDTIAYYNTVESVDGQWYVFIVDELGYTIGHHNPMFRNRDPAARVDSTGYFYGGDLLSATEAGRWVDYVLAQPGDGRRASETYVGGAARRADIRVGVVRASSIEVCCQRGGRTLQGCAAYFLRGVPPLLTFAQVSLSETVRLNTGVPGLESGSTAK